jgi:hypothetical protein
VEFVLNICDKGKIHCHQYSKTKKTVAAEAWSSFGIYVTKEKLLVKVGDIVHVQPLSKIYVTAMQMSERSRRTQMNYKCGETGVSSLQFM